MTNAQFETKNGELVIRVKLNEDHGPSKSGKTVIIASSHGAATVPGQDNVKVNLNVYRYR